MQDTNIMIVKREGPVTVAVPDELNTMTGYGWGPLGETAA